MVTAKSSFLIAKKKKNTHLSYWWLCKDENFLYSGNQGIIIDCELFLVRFPIVGLDCKTGSRACETDRLLSGFFTQLHKLCSLRRSFLHFQFFYSRIKWKPSTFNWIFLFYDIFAYWKDGKEHLLNWVTLRNQIGKILMESNSCILYSADLMFLQGPFVS